MSFFDRCYQALSAKHPDEKLQLVNQLAASPPTQDQLTGKAAILIPVPGRPNKPELINPRDVPKRALGTLEGRIALIHAIAHIEFNAINLALDACYRFRGMPLQYYHDWLSVAADEAKHFSLLRQRLRNLNSDYGDLPAHNGLWDAANKTAHDVLTRMALVPRVLEARGLDVTPGMLKKVNSIGDHETVKILELILEEEIPHVRIGSHWFEYCCQQQGLEPIGTFQKLLREYDTYLSPPINYEARQQAGFSKLELQYLESKGYIR